ncbi:ABC transporter ATP-binding protein [Aureicoccus marinus]|uniref:ABC transporter ATP-binding protein n=1 Tax=Aureicoccus marinus TaxID=754435 RepID=A0A2S7T8T2_9FLAO|nr:ATP-binding cassette domain-containing protein [Aureicoccus marinus]PQJ15991.1 ABC transporter ATP-binding protein [Aureicoccus marinus]
MVHTQDLEFAYPEGALLQFPDIQLPTNEHLLILGPSGVGKTTLLYLLAGLLLPKSGQLRIGDTSLESLNRKQLDQFRGKHIGLVFQKYQFIGALNVEENLRLRQGRKAGKEGKKRRMALVNRLGLQDQLHKKVSALSQGQQQRLAIALGIIHMPDLVLADEPTANLDNDNCEKVINLLKEEANISKSSLIIITHDYRVMKHFDNRIEL